MGLYEKFLSQPAAFLSEYALPFIAVLAILIFVHEWGHYIVARLCGVRVSTFSIGFGGEIFGWTNKNGTRSR
jgi:regulator of sigma E protease